MYQRILVPIDGSATSGRALDETVKFAQQHNAQVEVIYVLEDALYFENDDYLNYAELLHSMHCSGEKILAQAQQKLQQAGIVSETKLLEAQGARVANVIADEAQDYLADLIIIGTHGRSGFSRILLGSVAEGVVRTAHISILLIRGS